MNHKVINGLKNGVLARNKKLRCPFVE